MKILRSLVLAVSALTLAAGGALAEPRMKTGTDENGEQFSNHYYRELPNAVDVALLSRSDLPPGQFIMRLSAPAVKNGCPKFSPMDYSIGYDNMYLDVELADYRVDMRDAPKAPQYQCEVGNQIPLADIPLNTNDLMQRGISKVRFHYASLVDNYDMQLDSNYVNLTPTKKPSTARAGRFGGSKAYGMNSPLEIWLLPEDTVILYAPTEPQTKDGLADEIADVARGRGLIPLTDRLPKFMAPVTTPRQYYFIDKKKTYVSKIKDEAGHSFAILHHPKQVYGLDGDHTGWENIDIYMKKPGLYE